MIFAFAPSMDNAKTFWTAFRVKIGFFARGLAIARCLSTAAHPMNKEGR